MEFIQPKTRKKVDWALSERTRNIVRYYADYAGRSQDDVVDTFLRNIMADQNFIAWAKKKRNNKRIIAQLGLTGEDGSRTDE